MAKKKAKWLEAEVPELLKLLQETLEGAEEDEKAIGKAQKITDEIISRQPAEAGPLSVDESLKAAAASIEVSLNNIKAAYDNEISQMEDSEDDEEDEEEEEEASSKKSSKPGASSKDKKGKKGKKDPEPEEEEDEEDEEDSGDEEDYSEWSTKDLKKECRNRGIKVTKSMGKADLVKALEADDKE